jgi:hypothetical protein
LLSVAHTHIADAHRSAVRHNRELARSCREHAGRVGPRVGDT